MGLIFDTSYYSKLWWINRGNLTEFKNGGLWKLNGHNFNLKELFFDKFSGIQRTITEILF